MEREKSVDPQDQRPSSENKGDTHHHVLSSLLLPHSTIQNLQMLGDLTTPQLLDELCAAIPPQEPHSAHKLLSASPQLRYCRGRRPAHNVFAIDDNDADHLLCWRSGFAAAAPFL